MENMNGKNSNSRTKAPHVLAYPSKACQKAEEGWRRPISTQLI